jgi:hypothetical protein
MKTPIRFAAALVLVLLLGACATASQRSPLEQSLYDYTSAVRWSEYEVAATFIDPLTLATDPIDALEFERLKQYQVAGYRVRSAGTTGEGVFEQVVELRLVNRHTQVERVILDRQRWRWDAAAERWWLVSGLPAIPAQ